MPNRKTTTHTVSKSRDGPIIGGQISQNLENESASWQEQVKDGRKRMLSELKMYVFCHL